MPLTNVVEMDEPAPKGPLEALTEKEERKRGLAGFFRLWLGLAQMAGATIAALLLWDTGLSSATVTTLVLTTALTLLSRVLYRGRPKNSP